MRSYGHGGAAVGARHGCEIPTEPFRRPDSWPPLQRSEAPSPWDQGAVITASPTPITPVVRQRSRTAEPPRSRKSTKQALVRAAAVAILQARGESVPAIAEQLGITCYAVRQAARLIASTGSPAGGVR